MFYFYWYNIGFFVFDYCLFASIFGLKSMMSTMKHSQNNESVAIPRLESPSVKDLSNPLTDMMSKKGKPYIFVKSGKIYKKISYSDIQYIKASGAYCDIMLKGKYFTISASLNKVLDQLDTDTIVRCHRSFAVNVDMISSFDETTIKLECIDERITLPISMTYRSLMLDVLPRIKSC